MDWGWEITKWLLSIGYTVFLVWFGYKFSIDAELDDYGTREY
ncbi:MAG TPA: hypothetical protein VM050_07610 [Patescibacteria group bacterium]|nr:hypothetical protein [Patescibacteria group bacterium]